jgi:Pyruvate/2-oxoacid:ferredoxin oxidoreductase delta subunit
MTVRRSIITIDEDKCDGCGLCVPSCAEGAIQIVDGKAKLVSETYCDGLGACLGECPRGAISIEEREADPFDEEAAMAHVEAMKEDAEALEEEAPPGKGFRVPAFSCPGMAATALQERPGEAPDAADADAPSRLRNWPVQLALAPVEAPYFEGAELLLAADCSAFALARMHEKYLHGRVTLIGCPKLDDADAYIEKLGAILAKNDIRSLTVVRMEVPCCGGLEKIAAAARDRAKQDVPVQTVVIAIDGTVKQEIPAPAPAAGG